MSDHFSSEPVVLDIKEVISEKSERSSTPPYVRDIRNSITRHQEEISLLRNMPDPEFERYLTEKISGDLHNHIRALRNAERIKEVEDILKEDFENPIQGLLGMSDKQFDSYLARKISEVLRDFTADLRETERRKLVRELFGSDVLQSLAESNKDREVLQYICGLEPVISAIQEKQERIREEINNYDKINDHDNIKDLQKQLEDLQKQFEFHRKNVVKMIEKQGDNDKWNKFLKWNYTTGNTIVTYLTGLGGIVLSVSLYLASKEGTTPVSPATPAAVTETVTTTVAQTIISQQCAGQ